MFVLFGVVSPYDGSFMLGVFDTLELAIQGRKDYRTNSLTNGYGSDFESYAIYQTELNTIIDRPINLQPVDEFYPGKSKQRDWRKP